MLRDTMDRVGIAVIVAITAAGYFGGIRPVIAQQASRLFTERDVALKQDRLEELHTELDQADASVRSLERKVAAFRSSFEASPRVNERIGELAELAELLGVSVGSIRPGERIEGEGFRAQPVAITGTGQPGSIAGFLSQLRVVFPDMGARTFAVTGQTAESSSISAELVWFTGSDDQSVSNDASSE